MTQEKMTCEATLKLLPDPNKLKLVSKVDWTVDYSTLQLALETMPCKLVVERLGNVSFAHYKPVLGTLDFTGSK